jgi:hypothetical protein
MISVDEAKWTWGMMFSPGRFTKKRMSIGDALGFYYRLVIIPLIISLILGVLVGVAASAVLSHFVGILGFFGGLGTAAVAIGVVAMLLLVFIPIGMFISAALLHFFGKYVFRQFRSDYQATFAAVVYGEAPVILFFWIAIIPVIGLLYILIDIWGFIVEIFALSNLQKTSKLSVVGVMIGTVVVILVIAIILGIVGVLA